MKSMDREAERTLAITIQGKPAYASFDDDLFWLSRLPPPGKESSPGPSNAYICVPHQLILYCSYNSDSDGGVLTLRLLTPPCTSKAPLFSKKRLKAERLEW